MFAPVNVHWPMGRGGSSGYDHFRRFSLVSARHDMVTAAMDHGFAKTDHSAKIDAALADGSSTQDKRDWGGQKNAADSDQSRQIQTGGRHLTQLARQNSDNGRKAAQRGATIGSGDLRNTGEYELVIRHC